jgi:hypothetical protein
VQQEKPTLCVATKMLLSGCWNGRIVLKHEKSACLNLKHNALSQFHQVVRAEDNFSSQSRRQSRGSKVVLRAAVATPSGAENSSAAEFSRGSHWQVRSHVFRRCILLVGASP